MSEEGATKVRNQFAREGQEIVIPVRVSRSSSMGKSGAALEPPKPYVYAIEDDRFGGGIANGVAPTENRNLLCASVKFEAGKKVCALWRQIRAGFAARQSFFSRLGNRGNVGSYHVMEDAAARPAGVQPGRENIPGGALFSGNPDGGTQ